MAETERTYPQLIALMADNSTGNISPQDIRDLMESLRNSHGSIHIDTPAPTTIGGIGAFVKLAGTTTFGGLALRTDMPADNRIRYLSTVEQHVHLTVSATMQSLVGNNQVIALRIAKNGTTDSVSEVRTIFKAVNDQQSMMLHWDGHMAETDYLELWGANMTGVNNIQMDNLHVFMRGLFGH